MALGSGDIEFYFSAEVLTIAKAFALKPWEELEDAARIKFLNNAIAAFGQLMNDPVQAENIRTHLNLEFNRKAREYD